MTFYKTCKYCKVTYNTNQTLFMVRDRSFCCEDHRDLYMESQMGKIEIDTIHEMHKPKINNGMKKSPSTVSSNSLQDFFEIKEQIKEQIKEHSNERCVCVVM